MLKNDGTGILPPLGTLAAGRDDAAVSLIGPPLRLLLAALSSVWGHASERERLTFRVAVENATQLQVLCLGLSFISLCFV